MASITKREGKNGTTYRIVVSAGYDDKGRKIRHTKTIKPTGTQRQIEKAVQRAAADFEREVEQGFQLDGKQTFSKYSQYFLELKEREGKKARTIDGYRDLLTRINAEIGNLKLSEIRAGHLNKFYKSLAEPGARKGDEKAIAKPLLLETVKAQHLKIAELSRRSGVSETTIGGLLKGAAVNQASAAAVAAALGMDCKTLFNTVAKHNNTLSAKTILAHHRLISSILSQAEKEMLVPYNAAQKATPPAAPKKEPNYFQPAQIAAILDALNDEPLLWQALVTLLITTGARRGEVLGLTWDKVSFDLNRIKIDVALLYTRSRGSYLDSTKTGDTRYLTIPAQATDLLRRWKVEQDAQRAAMGDAWKDDTGFVFTRPDGSYIRPDSVTAWLNDFANRHGLFHINAHAFRHSVASILISNGVDPITVSKQLGHASVTTTEGFYAHLIAEQQARASRCLADVLLTDRPPAESKQA